MRVGGQSENDFLKKRDTRLCSFATENNPVERERMKTQKRNGIMKGKGGAGIWALGPSL